MHQSVDNALFHIVKFILWPFVCWYQFDQTRQDEIASGCRRGFPEPKGTHKGRRRRALTLPLPPKHNSTKRTSSQSECLLLSKLPPELRQIIWMECLGHMQIHITICDGEFLHDLCRSPDPGSCDSFLGYNGCHKYNEPYPGAMSKRRLLSTLVSCRQM